MRTGSPGETQVGSAGAMDLREECREHPEEDRNDMFCGAARDAQLPGLNRPDHGHMKTLKIGDPRDLVGE